MYQAYFNQLQLLNYNIDDLKILLNDDDKLDEKVDEVLESLKAQKDTLLIDNREKAERNLDKEPEIIDLRAKINELMEECKVKCEGVNEKLSEIKEKSGEMSQDTALALLQTAAAEIEEESEAIMQKFTDKEIDVEEFLDRFQNARKSMHMRKFKAEKMQEIIRKQAQGGGTSQKNSGIPPYANVPSLPYPVGPIMPMPRPY